MIRIQEAQKLVECGSGVSGSATMINTQWYLMLTGTLTLDWRDISRPGSTPRLDSVL